MSKYLLYEHANGESVITKDDMVEYRSDLYKDGKRQWKRMHPFPVGTFMAGDLALDNGYECKGEMTEADIFAELL